MTTYLFIGGPADGKRVPLPSPVRGFYYPVQREGGNGDSAIIEYAVYKPQRWRGGSKEIVVYLEESLTLEDAITMIFERYPEPAVVR